MSVKSALVGKLLLTLLVGDKHRPVDINNQLFLFSLDVCNLVEPPAIYLIYCPADWAAIGFLLVSCVCYLIRRPQQQINIWKRFSESAFEYVHRVIDDVRVASFPARPFQIDHESLNEKLNSHRAQTRLLHARAARRSFVLLRFAFVSQTAGTTNQTRSRPVSTSKPAQPSVFHIRTAGSILLDRRWLSIGSLVFDQ